MGNPERPYPDPSMYMVHVLNGLAWMVQLVFQLL